MIVMVIVMVGVVVNDMSQEHEETIIATTTEFFPPIPKLALRPSPGNTKVSEFA